MQLTIRYELERCRKCSLDRPHVSGDRLRRSAQSGVMRTSVGQVVRRASATSGAGCALGRIDAARTPTGGSFADQSGPATTSRVRRSGAFEPIDMTSEPAPVIDASPPARVTVNRGVTLTRIVIVALDRSATARRCDCAAAACGMTAANMVAAAVQIHDVCCIISLRQKGCCRPSFRNPQLKVVLSAVSEHVFRGGGDGGKTCLHDISRHGRRQARSPSKRTVTAPTGRRQGPRSVQSLFVRWGVS